jgi:hypothetical protein
MPDRGLAERRRQNGDVPLEAVLAEVAIKSESTIESMIVDQSETSAIDEAEVFVIVSSENHLSRFLYRLVNAKNFDAGEDFINSTAVR